MTLHTTLKVLYNSRVEDCDVMNRTALIEYRAKRDEWLRWYELDKAEPNSIQQQLFSMHFLDVTYRVISEARQAKGKSSPEPQSALLAHLLDQGYVATQVLAIRRLLDGRTAAFDGQKPSPQIDEIRACHYGEVSRTRLSHQRGSPQCHDQGCLKQGVHPSAVTLTAK